MGYTRGDIIAMVPDGHVWGRAESMDVWLAEGGAEEDFPSPWLCILSVPSEPVDLNLAEPWLEEDPDEVGSTIDRLPRLWFVDFDALPPGIRRRLDVPGGTATQGRNVRRFITNKQDDSTLPVRSSTNQGRHRHLGTSARNFVGARPSRRHNRGHI
ncbi:MAG: hypothetical protein GY925_03310 [Actinomycetia bacterium]|nr:hypothetical protein [Actinomycetes bacterium]